MRPVILTRPRPCSNELQIQLEQANLKVLHLPTLALSTSQNPEIEVEIKKNWHNYTGIIFVSQHAAQFAFEHMCRLGLTLSEHTWLACVGQGTRNTLLTLWSAHHRLIAPAPQDSQDSEGLWRAMCLHTELKNQRLLIVRAQTGRDVLLQMAHAAQIPCDTWACYTRQLQPWSDAQTAQFKQFTTRSSLIVITSIEGLKALLQQFEPNELPTNLLQQTIITIHPRIGIFAQTLGFQDVRLCPASELHQRIPIWADTTPF